MERKFKIGDRVIIRDDLIVGKLYYSDNGENDIFTYRMKNNMGKEGRIIEVNHVGYRIDIDPIHTYTDEMLKLSNSPYVDDYTNIDALLDNSRLNYYREKIDEALDSRLFKTDPEEFRRLVEEYKRLSDKINSKL